MTYRNANSRRTRSYRRSGQAWNPGRLAPRAWYDAELGQPKYGGAGAYVQLDGTSGDYIFTPDSAATSFSNDIEVVMRVKVTDWTAAANQTLAGKYVSTGNQRSWRFYVNTSGAIGITASADGTAVTSIIVTPTNALPDATWIWLRMRLDLTNGSNSVGTLETATDAGTNTEPSSWTANGTNTGATISGIFDGTAATEIGTFSNGTTERLTGQVGRCIVRSGFAGSTVVDFNASDCYGDGYWHADGYRWNLGLPKIYDRGPNGLAPATFGSGSNQPKWLPWTGVSGVYLPSVSGNGVQCPFSTSHRFGADGAIEAVLAGPLEASPTATWQLMGNVTSGAGGGGAALRLLTGRTFQFTWHDGTGFVGIFSTAAAPLGTVKMRVRWSAGVATFETATSVSGSYTQLGDPVAMSSNPNASGGTSTMYVGCNTPTQFWAEQPLARATATVDGSVVADFVAASCGQSGYTDTLGNVWTVNRSTSGRKIVVQSPVAVDSASSALLGTDDVIIGPAAAVPSAPSEWSIVWVGRRHESADDWAMLMSTGNNAASTSEGAAIFDFGSGSDQLSAMVHDGSGVNSFNSFPQDIPRGAQTVATLTGDASDLTFQVNGDPQATVPAPGGVVNMTTLLIGRATDGGYSDSQWRAAVVVDRILTATEHGLLTAYYRGGL